MQRPNPSPAPRTGTSRADVRDQEKRVAGRLDKAAILLSSLCLVHCIATAALAATLATAATTLANPAWHEAGFALAMTIGAVALGRGYAVHRRWRPLALGACGLALMGVGLALDHGGREIACTMAGVALLAFAHRLNMSHQGHSHTLVGAPREA